MAARSPALLAALLVAASLAACGGAREVVTQPPRPAVTDTLAAAPERTTLSVTFEIGEAMPPLASALRARVGAFWLKPAGAPWIKRSTGDVLAASGGGAVRLFTAEVPRGRYDSLAVVLADPFVTFGPNAGGPVTLPERGVIAVPAALDLDGPATLRVQLSPARSLARRDDGTWDFRPTLTWRVEP